MSLLCTHFLTDRKIMLELPSAASLSDICVLLSGDYYTCKMMWIIFHKCFILFNLQDAPGGGVTAGLMTARTVCRIIVRDLCGKYCWENSVLYSPPWCTKGSSRHSKRYRCFIVLC